MHGFNLLRSRLSQLGETKPFFFFSSIFEFSPIVGLPFEIQIIKADPSGFGACIPKRRAGRSVLAVILWP